MSGRHRGKVGAHGGAVAATLAVVLAVGAGTWLGVRRAEQQRCTGRLPLTVAAAPEIAGAVRHAAGAWTAAGAAVDGRCVAVTVTAVDPAAGAAAIARRHRVTLTGLDGAAPAEPSPHVWIPDSRSWLMRLRAEASGFTPSDATPVASSPVVVAMPQPVAEDVGWPDRRIGWPDLVQRITSPRPISMGTVDPTRDAAGLSGLLALGRVAHTGAAARERTVGVLRALAGDSSSLRADLLQRFPRERGEIAAKLNAAPLSEQNVVDFNARRPAVPLAALYLDPAPAPLDYPFAVLPEVDVTTAAAATGLREALQRPAFRDALAAAGLRGPDGVTGAAFAAPVGAPAVPAPAAAAPSPAPSGAAPAPAPAPAAAAEASEADSRAISRALGSWAAVTMPGRVLAVLDVSPSMREAVPSAGGASRAEVTKLAAARGLGLFDDRWQVGLWTFATGLDGARPYRQLVPVTPLTAGRPRLSAALATVRPAATGGTGLYDTALAAYRHVQDTWQDGRVNTVVLFTDGRNDNPAGLTRDALVSRLRDAADPDRPVRLIIIGIGPDVDRAELAGVAAATSQGGVYVTRDPAQISDIFLEAIAARSGVDR